MAVAELKEALTKFRLECLPIEWVEDTWKGDFQGSSELPSEYELQLDQELLITLQEIRNLLKIWASTDDDDDDEEEDVSVHSSNRLNDSSADENNEQQEKAVTNISIDDKKSWRMIGHGVNKRSLLPLLNCLISRFSEENCSDEEMARSVEAARLYLSMLSVSGSYIFGIYNAYVFRQTLQILCSANKLYAAAQPVKSKKGKKKGESESNNEIEDVDNSETHKELSPSESKILIQNLMLILEDLKCCLNSFSLRSDRDTCNYTVRALIQVVQAERTSCNFLNNIVSKGTTTYLAKLSYEIIDILCSNVHGDVSLTCQSLVRLAKPLVCIYDILKWQHVTKDSVIVRDHVTAYLLWLAETNVDSHDRIIALIQQVFISIPDKADIRTKCVNYIIDFISKCPYHLYAEIVLWLMSCCYAESVKNRMSGLEIITRLINSKETHTGSLNNSNESANNSSENLLGSPSNIENKLSLVVNHRFYLATILNRCIDISSRVRAKALSIFGSLILSKERLIAPIMEQLFIRNTDLNECHFRKEFLDMHEFFLKKQYLKPTPRMEPLPNCDLILDLLEQSVEDEKVFVRKNALQVIGNICLLNEKFITQTRLNLLIDACKDLSVGVRKMVVQSLTDLLMRYPSNSLLPTSWVLGVVPLFAENELKAQERILEISQEVILHNLVTYNHSKSEHHQLPWQIINLIMKYDMRKLFKYACQSWFRSKKINNQLYTVLQSYVGTSDENTKAAWYFLVCLSEFADIPNTKFVLEYLYNEILSPSDVDELTSQLVMKLIVLNWRRLSENETHKLGISLKERLNNFTIPMALISSAVDIVFKSMSGNAKSWATDLIKVCEARIKNLIKIDPNNFEPGNEELLSIDKDDEILCRYIFILGDLAHIAPDVVSKDTIKSLSKLIDIAFWEPERIEQDVGILHATTVVTLGKLCLQNHLIAKSIVPLFGNLVAIESPAPVKINANIALTDLCIRFSALVEPYFGDMCVCLRDPDREVRKNILNLISRLVQEDFLKLKAPVFIYLLSMMRDPEDDIRDFACSFLVNSIVQKHPHIMSQHFVQTIMFLNEFKMPPEISPQERSTFCLKGEEQCETRRKIYRFMLNNMMDDMKFKTIYRMCTEILDPVSDGFIELDYDGTAVLKDAFFVLCCDEIKLSGRGRGTLNADDEDEDAEAVMAAKTVVMNQLFRNIVKNNLSDNVVPTINKLKHKLMSLKSPLVKDLMICLREIMSDFKEEVEEILSADPDLAAEIKHDLRQMELERNSSNNQSEGNETGEGNSHDQDSIMAQMTDIAKRLSVSVLKHGPGGIAMNSDDSNESDDNANQGHDTSISKHSSGKKRSSRKVNGSGSAFKKSPPKRKSSLSSVQKTPQSSSSRNKGHKRK